MIRMTKEKAMAVSKALDNINGFEAFMSMVEQDINEAADMCDIIDFSKTLMDMLEVELERRKKILESL